MVEADLIAALDSGHLAGAVLDVFQAEPLPTESPIWRHPKITATPHIAALTDTAAALAFIGDCVARCENGRPLDHVVDLDRGY
jgi:glyoxylate/hydroxypyruvate reductase A